MGKKKHAKLVRAEFLSTLQLEISKVYHSTKSDELSRVGHYYEEVFIKTCNTFGFPRYKSYCKVRLQSSSVVYIMDLHSKVQDFIGNKDLMITILTESQLLKDRPNIH